MPGETAYRFIPGAGSCRLPAEEHMFGKKINISFWSFQLSILVLVFLLGGVFYKNRIQPFPFLYKGYKALTVMFRENKQVRPSVLEPIVYQGEGVVTYDKDAASGGFTVMQGLYKEGAQLRLVDMNGTLLHTWNVDFFKIWPNPNHIYPETRIPKGPYNYHIQGMAILEDGSVLVNLGNLGTVKLDKDSNVVWTVDRATHHSITRTEDGKFWIPASRDIREIPKELLLMGVSKQWLVTKNSGKYENVLLLVDENGAVVKEISVLKALVDGGFENELYDTLSIHKTDPTHINDIEVVTEAMASSLPDVTTGDLLVSIRQLHMLAIFDQDSGQIKWHFRGPWLMQHDPDIMSDGKIVVFNNRRKSLNLAGRISGSNLMVLDPATSEIDIIYPTNDEQSFYSYIMGTHQLLSNGNRLITESCAGRVFEISSGGEIVWDFIQPYDETHAALIECSERIDPDYFDVDFLAVLKQDNKKKE